MPPGVNRLDHFVLTVADAEATVRFYRDVLGLTVEAFGEGRLALRAGAQKINLHVAGREIAPHAARPLPGSADFCLISARPVAETARELEALNVPVELGRAPARPAP